ncbi:Gfo/Idh/MocA family protein [Vitiosangium sp. GDMCC 1.1324]|uniref:Gfo/Idh/MocA family protein n=1 Tax=Vitiosangium sp. (strain GDMCC 1.1324) TaxID=2138576 RepID=UPI000D3CABF0|nr:Gfo/Idh/MocA family oxidoreductase [Vitiosangium sp. GDMCC 1.1324]PTL85178.1 gfo/Idh/MocA family oxidoreductase [Vitiosangium sp. GDMCC 1.1324]
MRDAIRWGILGTGQIAGLFAKGLREIPEARLVAVGSRSSQNAERFARQYGVARAYATYEELVRDAEVDVVYVATPHTAHREHCVLALDHGKPVLCEKPFTVNAAEATAVVAAARARGLFCMEAMWMHFVPVMRELETLVSAGTIGDVRMLTAHLGIPFEFAPQHRLFDPALGGGALLDLGVYPLSLALRLMGKPIRISSQAVLGRTGVDEQCTVLLEFPEGRQAAITTSLRNRTPDDATLMGTEGMIHLHAPIYRPETLSLVRTPRIALASETSRIREFADRLGLDRLTHNRWVREAVDFVRTERVTRRVIGNGYAHEALEVMRCLREGLWESPLMPLAESVELMRTVDAIRLEWTRQGRE